MTVTLEHSPRIAALLADAPEFVTPSWIAKECNLSIATVNHAIRTGKLKAKSIGCRADGKPAAHLVRPEHAMLLWGYRFID